MLIEIWNDFTCPFCYIGKKNIDDAIINLGISVEVKSYSFQTYPTCPKDSSNTIYKVATENGMTLEQAQEKSKYIEKMASEVGLKFNMDDVIMTNTIDAHRLAIYAEKYDLRNKVTERLLKAVFIESKDIGNYNTLAELSSEIGLNYNKVIEMLESNKHKEEVHKEIKDAIKINVSGVPYFLINKKYAINGVQSSKTIEKILRKVIKEEEIKNILYKNKVMCNEQGCEIS